MKRIAILALLATQAGANEASEELPSVYGSYEVETIMGPVTCVDFRFQGTAMPNSSLGVALSQPDDMSDRTANNVCLRAEAENLN